MSREPRERNFGLINVASSLQGPLLTAVHLSWSEWYAKLWGKYEIIYVLSSNPKVLEALQGSLHAHVNAHKLYNKSL